MFERFTAHAQTIVLNASHRARELGADHIGSTHLLLALAGGEGSTGAILTGAGIDPDRLTRLIGPTALDADALAAVGIDVAAVRASAERSFGVGALNRAVRSNRRGNLPFTKDAKKTLKLAVREALRLGHQSIHSGHLLLAILRITDGEGHALLRQAGGNPVALRTEVEASCGLPRSA